MRLRQPHIACSHGFVSGAIIRNCAAAGKSNAALLPVARGCGQSMLAAMAAKSRNMPWEATMSDLVEKSTASKVYWRLLPLAILTYFLCYLDRINVGFAALPLNQEIGLDAATYGMAGRALF